ncbi:hypothetical protein GCM10027599_05680 [Yimella radicis]
MRLTALLGSGDEEDRGRRAVLGAPIDAFDRASENQRWFGDRRATGMRDTDAAGQAGCHLLLAGTHIGEERIEVGAATGRDQRLGESARGLMAVVATQVQDDLFVGDQRHDVSFRRCVRR